MKQQMIQTLQDQAEFDAMKPSPRHAADDDLVAEFGSPQVVDEFDSVVAEQQEAMVAQMADMEV